MTKKDKISEVLVVAGLAAFAYYRYSKLTHEEKTNIQEDIKETGKKIVQEFIPKELRNYLPAFLKDRI